MYIKTQIVLLLFGVQLYYGYSIAKIQIENGTEKYEVRELPNKTIEFVNPKRKEPTMREITYYRVIEKPYFPKSYNQDDKNLEEELDFDETLRPFTNSHGYQFIDWGAQEENNPDQDNNATAIASNSTNNKIDKASINKDIIDEDDKTNDESSEEIATDKNENNNEDEELDDDYDDNEDKEKERHNDNNDSMEFYNEKDDSSHKNNNENKDDDENEREDTENVTEKKNDYIFIDSIDDNNIHIKLNKTTENSKIENIEADVNNEINDMKLKNNNESSNDDKIGKTEVKNKTNDIVKKLRNQLFNSTKEKYISIKRQQENVTTSKQTRRKREVNYKDIPEAPTLPDLDITAFPDYLRRMLENHPRIHITYNDTTQNNNRSNLQSRLEDDEQNDYYDLPEPKIEIRNNFSDEEDLIENKDVNKESLRITRNVKENFKSNNDDKIVRTNSHVFHDKLREMFENIEKRFTKDGKKPRTYGMNLRGDTTQMWNDMTGTSIEINESEDNSRALNTVPDSKSNEINYKDDDTETTLTPENLMVEHEEERYINKPAPIDSEKFMQDTLLPTHNPAVPNTKLPSLSQLPDLKIDHIEQIPRTNVNLDDNPKQDNNILTTSAPHDLKINHNIEQIPDKNDMILSDFLPDLKIEHIEQIPRVYRKAENTSPTISDRNVKEIIEFATKASAISNKIEETTQIPSKINVKSPQDIDIAKLDNKDLQLKMEEAFDNILKRFRSLEPNAKDPKIEADHVNLKENLNRNSLKTYGIHLEGDHGYIWNDYNNPGKPINVGNLENVNTTELQQITEKGESTMNPDEVEIISEITTEKSKDVAKDEIKEGSIKIENDSKVTTDKTEKDKNDQTEQTEKNDKDIENPEDTTKEDLESGEYVDKKDLNTTITVKNDTETKLALDDLLKRDEFWQWLSDWSTTYLEVLNERNKILVKNEIARQLETQNNKNTLSDDANEKPDVQQDKDRTVNNEDIPKSNTINRINKTETTSSKQDAKNNNTNALENENINSEILDNKGNPSEIKGSKCKNKKNNNSPFTINDKTIYGSAVASDNASNVFIFYPDVKDNKTVQEVQPLQNKEKTDDQILSEPSSNLIIDETLRCNEDDVSEQDDEKNKYTNKKHNTLPLTVNAETIYGSAVATDHVTNIFIFYPNKEYSQAMQQIEPVLEKVKSENLIPVDPPANITFDERLGSDDDKFESEETETEKYHLAKPEYIEDTDHKVSDENNSINVTTISEPFNGTTTESNIVRTTQSYGLPTTKIDNFVKESIESNEIQDKATKNDEDATTTNTLDVNASEDAMTKISKKEPTESAKNELALPASIIKDAAKTENVTTSAEKDVIDPDVSVTTTEISDKNATTTDDKTITIDKNVADSDDGVTSQISDKDATMADDQTVLPDKDVTTADDKTSLTEKDATTTDDKTTSIDKDATAADETTALPDKDAPTADDNIALTNKDATKADDTTALTDKDVTIPDDAEITSESPENDSAKSELSTDVKTIETDKKEKTDEDPKDETEATTSDITEAPAKK